MQLLCTNCSRVLEFAGERPSFCAYCGQPLAEANPLHADLTVKFNGGPAETVGPYRLLRPIGSGGMGTVYEAEESASGRRVALKLLDGDAADSPEAMRRFRQEGRLMSQLAHPNCVFVLAADEDAGRPYIVMELMPGTTLKELIAEHGPLPPEEAVAKVLDVIDGLQEAHRLGVIHRDVKPSNCFVAPDGSVKIGDFGLAKQLRGDAHLTQSGTFLGTPLFASPEQIKGGAIGVRTDVYSVAATLYYLLTGQAPFQKSNATATMARIVSEAAPSMRSVRPELPAALDRVVLRGLERHPGRRWRDLARFRQALLRFMPDHPSIAGMGMRLGAYLLDAALFLALALLTRTALRWLAGPEELSLAVRLAMHGIFAGCWLAYFVWLEGLWGGSVGKRLLGLRVWRAHGSDPPGFRRALVRSLVFYAAFNLLSGLFDELAPAKEFGGWVLLWLAPKVAGLVVLVSTMRARNGYRGLHEILSHSRVVMLPRPDQRRLADDADGDRLRRSLVPAEGVPEALSSFRILGTVSTSGDTQVLLGEDSTLGREACIRLRGLAETLADATRRELSRASRLRWLTCGREGGRHWDAFVAPLGTPLTDIVPSGRRLGWRELRPILQNLTDELAAACADGTLPATLTLEQVWVQPNGQIQVLDFPLTGVAPASNSPSQRGEGKVPHPRPHPHEGGGKFLGLAPLSPTTRGVGRGEQEAAFDFLRQVAVFSLEGKPNVCPGQSVKAPMPLYARRLLDRLLGVRDPYRTLAQLQTDLAACHDQPVEVTRRQRAAHLAVLVTFLSLGLASMLAPTLSYGILFDAVAVRTLPHLIARDRRALQEIDTKGFFMAEEWANLDPAGDLRARLEKKLAMDRTQLDRSGQALGWLAGYLKLDPSDAIDGFFGGAPILDPREDFRKAVRSADFPDEDLRENTLRTIAVGISVWPLLWVLWAFVFRGGFALSLTGLALVRADGRKAARWQCAWRVLLTWAPVTLLLALSVWLNAHSGGLLVLYWIIWFSAVAVLVSYVVLALVFPTRSLHDWLAGTYLVPK
jgi:hypothetical protein